MGNTFHQPGFEDVTASHDDDRNGVRLLLHHPSRRSTNRHDHVRSEAHQLRRMGAHSVGILTTEAQINPQVAPFDPAQLRKSVSEYAYV